MVAALKDTAREHDATVRIDITHKYDAYRLTKELPIIQRSAALLQAMGVEPRFEISGGGSDVNIFAQRGLTIANLSVGYRAIHSTDEHIAVADLGRAAELVVRLLETS
jgi:tripeptide aminopeptidase